MVARCRPHHDPTYDAAGNMTLRPDPADPDDTNDAFKHIFDAWNRLVKVENDSTGNDVIVYKYDGLNRIIEKRTDTTANGTIDASDDARQYYYSAQWQVIEEADDPSGGTYAIDKRFIWGKRYIDDLVAREHDTGSGFVRHYILQDRTWNVVALALTDGTIGERYRYSSQGDRVIMNASFDDDYDFDGDWKDNVSAYDLNCGSKGQWHEEITKLILRRFRFDDPLLKVFVTRDPHPDIYPDGMNTYAAYHVMYGGVDPMGLRLPPGEQEIADDLKEEQAAERRGIQAACNRKREWRVSGKKKDGPEVDWKYRYDATYTPSNCTLTYSMRIQIIGDDSAARQKSYHLFSHWKNAVDSYMDNFKLVTDEGCCCPCKEILIDFEVDFVGIERSVTLNRRDLTTSTSYNNEYWISEDQEVRTYSSKGRSSMGKWYLGEDRVSKAPYPTAVHEVGHMFGLEDEYLDSDFDCATFRL